MKTYRPRLFPQSTRRFLLGLAAFCLTAGAFAVLHGGIG
jgi:hypothetical protein